MTERGVKDSGWKTPDNIEAPVSKPITDPKKGWVGQPSPDPNVGQPPSSPDVGHGHPDGRGHQGGYGKE